MKLKNIIFIILLFLFFYLIFNNSVFAAVSSSDLNIVDFDDDIINAFYKIPESSSSNYWYYVYRTSLDTSVIFLSKSNYPNLKQYIISSSSKTWDSRIGFMHYFNHDGNLTGVRYIYDESSKTFYLSEYTSHGNYYHYTKQNSYDICYFTNMTVYTDNTYSTVFFVPVTGVTIPALEMAQEVPTAMVQTLKILIPVGLVVFGIGLSVYLIRRILY